MGRFHHWVTVKKAAMHIGIEVSVWVPAFNSFEHRHRSEIVGSYGMSVSHFLRDTQLFHSGCAILRSHRQYARGRLRPSEGPPTLICSPGLILSHEWLFLLSGGLALVGERGIFALPFTGWICQPVYEVQEGFLWLWGPSGAVCSCL